MGAASSAAVPPRPAAPEGTEAPPTPATAATPDRPDPERVQARWTAAGERTVAIVSPSFATRSEAQAMLARMREHVQKTLPEGTELGAEVFESGSGFRAALYPFGSREEAQILNATMVARGWRTRAVDF